MKVFGFAGWSGSGKTTLIEQLVPRFTRAGLVVSLVKHAHRSFDVDQPGKDSYRHREAGCKEVMVSSEKRWVIQHELRGDPEPALEQQIERMSPCDLLLIEGYKRYPMPKLEVYRAAERQAAPSPGGSAHRRHRHRRTAPDEAAALRPRRVRSDRGVRPHPLPAETMNPKR